MSDLLLDLISHRAWADAEHGRAILAHAAARTDHALRHRLHHMFSVQRLFLWSIGGASSSEVPPIEAYATTDALVGAARASIEQERAYIQIATPAALDERVAIPFFDDPPLRVTRSEALMQSVLHSEHHRAQNAIRLRELGHVAPTTDLIIWYWQGRPAPTWSAGE